jgi:hypothetical protein
MPSVAAGFDEFAGVYNEDIKPRNAPRVQSLLCYEPGQGTHTNSIPSTLHYSHPAYKNDFLSIRINSALPPLRSIQNPPDRSLHSSDRQSYPSFNSISPSYSGNPGLENDYENNRFSYKQPSFYESAQRTHHIYPLYQGVQERPTKDFMYDRSPQHSPYGEPYRADMDRSPRLMNNAQYTGFGVLGDVVDSRNKRRRRNLPKPVTDILKRWFHEHLDHPYPSEEDKQMFIARTGLTISQVN